MDQLDAEALEALRPVAKRHNLEVERGSGGSYGDDYYHVKFEFHKKGSGIEAESFRKFAAQYGMNPGWLGSIVMLQWDGPMKHPITKKPIAKGLYPAKIMGMTRRGMILVSFLDDTHGDTRWQYYHTQIIEGHELASKKKHRKGAPE